MADDPKKPDDDIDLFSEDELAGDAADADEPPPEEADEPPPPDLDALEEGAGRNVMAELSEVLAADGIIVEPADDPVTFLQHLLTAAKTKQASGEADAAPPEDVQGGTPENMDRAQPEPVQLAVRFDALRKRHDGLAAELAGERLQRHLAEVRTLEQSGAATPKMAQRWREALTARRLSLAGGPPHPDVARTFAEMGVARELGGDRVRMALARAEKEPEWAAWDRSEDARARQEKTGDELASMAGVPAKKK